MLNFTQLRVFFQAAKYENFTQAAQKLFITQPAVTAQIKLFEDYCGLKLFKKRGRKIYLTDEGKTLYDYACKMIESEKEFERLIDDLKELKRGLLRLGTAKTYARYFMPYLMPRFHEVYPDIKIRLDEGSSRDMMHSLLDLRNEVAVIAQADDHPDVQFTPFTKEELVIILAPDHRLAFKKSIAFEELAQEPIIMKEIGSGTRRLVNSLFDQYHCEPDILMETSNTEFIKQLVQRGEGVSFLVKEAVVQELKEKKLATVSLKKVPVFLDVSIAYLKGQRLSRPAQAFVNLLMELIPEADRSRQGISALMGKLLVKKAD